MPCKKYYSATFTKNFVLDKTTQTWICKSNFFLHSWVLSVLWYNEVVLNNLAVNNVLNFRIPVLLVEMRSQMNEIQETR